MFNILQRKDILFLKKGFHLIKFCYYLLFLFILYIILQHLNIILKYQKYYIDIYIEQSLCKVLVFKFLLACFEKMIKYYIR